MEISSPRGKRNLLARILRNKSVAKVSNQCMEASLRGSERHILILKEEKYNYL